MRIEVELIKALRAPIAVAVVLLAASGGLAADAWSRIVRAEAAEQAREAAAGELQRNVNALRGERDNAIAYGPRFVGLESAGAFEPHSRPLLIDRFEAAILPWRSQVKRYELGISGDAQLPGMTDLSMHTVRSATLTFEMMPRHEESFLALAGAVVEAMPGLRALERCELGRVSEDSDDALKASCTLNLYRFERRADPSGGMVIGPGGLPGIGGSR